MLFIRRGEVLAQGSAGRGSVRVFLLAVAFALASLEWLPVPYVWIGIAFAAAAIAGAWQLRGGWLGAPLLSLAAAALALALGEAALAWLEQRDPIQHVTEGYELDYSDDVLGTAPLPGTRARSRKSHDGEVIYDITYTYDAAGLRQTPGPQPASRCRCALFFGCSFTLGEGVADAEAMPFQVAAQAAGRVEAYNLGFHGYGPHQMLSALEHERVERVLGCKPTHVIHQAVPAHVARVAGKVPWAPHAPRYRLDVAWNAGTAFYAGHFDDESRVAPWWLDVAKSQVQKSALYRALGAALRRRISADDVELWLGVVARSRDEVRRRWPDAEFHVLLWDLHGGDELFDEMLAGLEARQIPTHLVRSILPGYEEDPRPYEIHPLDRHPNAAAHRIIARYVVDEILFPAGVGDCPD